MSARILNCRLWLAAGLAVLAAPFARAGEGTIPICQADVPLAITNSGSYVFTENITVTTPAITGVVVQADHVTIDLNGFTLAGPGTNSGYGIVQLSGLGLTVRNGFVVDWRGFLKGGIVLGGRNNRVENVTVSDCAFGILGGPGNVISMCIAATNSLDGISVQEGSTVERCYAGGNAGWGIHAQPGSTVKECSTAWNGAGIYVHQGTVAECASFASMAGNGITVDYDAVVERCAVFGAVAAGIEAGNGCAVRRCIATVCSNGVVAGDQCVIEWVAVRGGTGAGIVADDGNIVRRCVVSTNSGDGIDVDSDCLVVGNLCTELSVTGITKVAGIRVRGTDNRIEENTCNRNETGIVVENGGNLIVKNLVGYNTFTNYDLASGNTVGPIVSDPVAWEKPWANFRFGHAP
jgi:parallel beta-helix repeat protein